MGTLFPGGLMVSLGLASEFPTHYSWLGWAWESIPPENPAAPPAPWHEQMSLIHEQIL